MLQQLKKNLSTEALKGFRGETSSTPHKSRTRVPEVPVVPSAGSSIQVMSVDRMTLLMRFFFLCSLSV
jgi:hypothetical protein